MPRPIKCRRICSLPQTKGFAPIDAHKGCCSGTVPLRIDEYEVIRLIDLESMTQEECAAQMCIARTTVTGIYDSARRKIADALIHNKSLVIEGGEVTVCEHRGNGCTEHEKHCCRRNSTDHEDKPDAL